MEVETAWRQGNRLSRTDIHRHLRLVDDAPDFCGRPPTGEEVMREALLLARDYARLHLTRLSSDDPSRCDVEALASGRPLRRASEAP